MIREILRTHSVNDKNWQFLLLSSIYRGTWFIKPDIAIAQGDAIDKLLNKDWSGSDQTQDLKVRGALPIVVIDEEGSFVAQNSIEKSASSIFDKAPEGSIAIVPLKGTMLKYGTLCTYGTEEIAAYVLDAAAHKNISSIVLDIDSGGGAVDAVAPIAQAIRKAIDVYNKVVIASVDLCCSAAYWAASNCTHIVANNDVSAEIGSIGVMGQFMDVQPVYEEKGYKFHKIYSTHSDYKHRPFNKALNGEYDEIKSEELDPLAIRFQNEIKTNRGEKLNQEIPGILAGRTFFAKKAKEHGLIDSVGTLDTAYEVARELQDNATINSYLKS